MKSSTLYYALILGFLSAVGVSALDIYLPSLPSIAKDFHTDGSTMQLSLTSYFVAMAIAQIVYGSMSDMFGRRPPLIAGMTIYVIGAVGCALAPSVHALIAFRFIQGLGAGAGAVIARAIVRDLHTGPEAARLMSLLMLVFSISPLLAPLAGSFIVSVATWRDIFWVLTAFGLLGVFLVTFVLNETRTREKRLESSLSGAFRNYGHLLTDTYFMGIVGIAAFGMSSYMVYVSNSSFVIIEHFQLSPSAYGVMFALNAIPFFVFSQMNARLAKRYGLRRVVRTAALLYASMMVMLLGTRLAGIDNFVVMTVLLLAGYGFLGLVVPSSAVLALEAHGRIAGTASALMGTLQFVAASAVTAVVSLFFDGTSLPMIAGIGLCSIMVVLFSLVTLRPTAGRVFAAE
ncbi:multidrug effflux MFS transporter [Allorhizobium taibaishanense]|uniref:Bcr/CflA family efflux transporter n=1 Tax=Allorhizobium taibaishanense TaxID=887144 RepID=A0A1Q9AAT0_9HYPH|nr:multidrug effflux MFS transporter [Allorhizobium taibaishanense]MBB4010430.1 DHA1 family bicyclomycin/chloramphenicol resistance-like MFS transporter [Allorhizobium taibaishanense]OLP51992.1 Bcr/CflA family drug resistance efflux transporter [Allorhizobium taibaishanense]